MGKYEDLMNTYPFQEIGRDWTAPIEKGTLIGFTGLGKDKGISASYPVWRVIGNEIQFVLYVCSRTGRPVIGNTWFGSQELCINVEPVVVDIEIINPTSFGNEIAEVFNFKTTQQ